MYENKYQGNRAAPKPRLIIEEPGHELEPIVETAIKNKQLLSQFSQFGDSVDTNVISFDEHGNHYDLPVCKFALLVNLQLGIPHDHPDFPVIKKLDTRFKANTYYLQYPKPVVWLKHEGYCHIPGFTRYVINKEGVVRNAASGIIVERSPWGTHKMVRDQSTNKLINVDNNTLKMLAFVKLPDDFIDFGFGARSHELKFNEGKIEWVHRPSIVVKNMKDGSVGTYASVIHFAKMAVKDFTASGKVSYLNENDLANKVVTIDEFQIRYESFDPSAPVAEENIQVQVPQVSAPELPVPQQAAVDIAASAVSASAVFEEF